MVTVEFLNPPGLVLLRFSGEVTVDEAVEAAHAARQYPVSAPALNDCRQMSSPFSMQALQAVAERLPPPRPCATRAPVANLVTHPVDFGMHRVFMARYERRLEREHLVFYSWDDAVRALGFDPAQLPDPLAT